MLRLRALVLFGVIAFWSVCAAAAMPSQRESQAVHNGWISPFAQVEQSKPVVLASGNYWSRYSDYYYVPGKGFYRTKSYYDRHRSHSRHKYLHDKKWSHRHGKAYYKKHHFDRMHHYKKRYYRHHRSYDRSSFRYQVCYKSGSVIICIGG